MYHSETAIIRTGHDVAKLVHRSRLRYGTRPTRVAVAALSPSDAKHAEERLNREASACGCGNAAAAASACFFGYVAFLFFLHGAPPHWDLIDLLWGLILTIGAALCGKALGLLRAQRRWLTELERLRTQISLASEGEGD